MSRRRRRGFTLLEVLVAIAILGLGMTVLLSSQVGLFSSAQNSENLSLAENLLRCKMSEVEVDLMKKGYSLTDEKDEGECCQDEEAHAFHCSWKVERVELPQPPGLGSVDGGSDLDLGPLGSASPGAGMGNTTGLGAFGGLAALQAGGPSVLGDGGLGGLASLLGSSSMGGTQGMAPLVMSMVYPDLKPMLEASIRKLTVDVEWKTGLKKHDLSVIQYVTNPMMGGFDPNAAKGLDQLLPQGASPLGTGATNPTPTGATR
jgi:general secretion pathway protein I